jgi:hypothetical protein
LTRATVTASDVAAGLSQVLALKCLSVYHLTIWPSSR